MDDIIGTNEAVASQRCMMIRAEISHMAQILALARQKLRMLCRVVNKTLPFGWDARVDEAGYVVFFDPVNSNTSMQFPTDPAGQEEGEWGGVVPLGKTLEQLDAYKRYAQEVTGLAEAIENKKLELQRWEMRVQGAGPGGLEAVRQELETSILDSAHLVFTTLHKAGSSSVLNGTKLAVGVVDEAAQAIDPSTLIPLQVSRFERAL